MTENLLPSFAIAGAIRYLLIISKYADIIRNRIEISTPLNSWKRGNINFISKDTLFYNKIN